MEAVCDERVSFGKLARSHTQYGTTSSARSTRVDNTDSFIQHIVQAGDTLQRVAVKYGVAVSFQSCLTSAVWSGAALMPAAVPLNTAGFIFWLCLEYGNRYCSFGPHSTGRSAIAIWQPYIRTRNPNPKLTLTLNAPGQVTHMFATQIWTNTEHILFIVAIC